MGNRHIHILLVDDNRDDILLTKITLEKHNPNFKIDTSSSGEDCLDRLKEKRYNVLLLDYSLPDMDGISVLKAVLKQGHNLPIIMVTGQGNEEVAVKSMKKGAYDYIIKSEDYRKILPFIIQKVIEKFELNKMKTKLEEETLDKKTKLEATLNSTSDGILMISYTSRNESYVSIANRRFEEIFNINIDANSKKKVSLSFLNEKLDKAWGCSMNADNKFLELFTDKTVEKVDIIENLMTRNRVIERYTGPVYDESKKIIGRIWSFRDVTKRIELEKKLKRLSITDSLTLLYNQGHFYEVLDKEVERARRLNHKLCLILFDIDKFKEYNDTHGHQKGDCVLRKIGQIIQKCIRENVDTGYRYGGDEFTVILPETSIAQALSVAERIRRSFQNCKYSTLSLGLIDFKPTYTCDYLVKYADEAMYMAKKSGGNKVHIWNNNNSPKGVSCVPFGQG